MCGITGFSGADAATVVSCMTRSIAHRGPDDEGVWSSARHQMAIGNRRLKIIDLSDGGHQPMTTPDGRYALTFNGEIFNYRELRDELRQGGSQFRSRTDTEVVLNALVKWGADAIPKLEGMFAFALWDEREQRLLLARDRLGIKPVFYCTHGDQIAFASEIRPILISGIVEPALDEEMLESFLRLLWIPEPGTLFRGIRKLEPGCLAEWGGSELKVRRFWELPTPMMHEPGAELLSQADVSRQLREILQRAVARQLESDVPVGAFLSGGVDSTAIVALAAGLGRRDLKTYSIGFSSSDRKGDGSLDDVRFARMAANHYGLHHQEIRLSPDVVDLLPKMVRHLEDPVADPAAINTYLVCKAARATSTVLLSGSGGDELFGGYQKYTATLFGASYHRYVGPFGRALLEPAAAALPVAIGRMGLRTVRRAKRFLRHAGRGAFDRFIGFSSYYDADELEELLGGDPSGNVDPLLGIRPLSQAWEKRATGDPVDQMTYVDLKYYLPGLGLAYMDRASMAASVEVRVPLLDDSVVDFVARLPGTFKVDGWRTKIILRDALKGLVPDEILRRPKAPFAAPVRAWLRNDLAPLIDEYLGPSRILSRGLLNPGVVYRLVKEHRSGIEDHSLRIWALLTLEVWLQEFIDNSAQFRTLARVEQ